MERPCNSRNNVPLSGISDEKPLLLAGNPFEQLVNLFLSNERALRELRQLSLRLSETRDYLARTDCNELLGTTELARLKRNRTAVLKRLRTQRLEAERLLALHNAE
jgi:hypothetical protein